MIVKKTNKKGTKKKKGASVILAKDLGEEPGFLRHFEIEIVWQPFEFGVGRNTSFQRASSAAEKMGFQISNR